MSGQISADPYVLYLCEEFGISDKKGEKKRGIDSRIESIAQSVDLTVSESQTGKPFKVSVWMTSTNKIWSPLKNFFRAIYNTIFKMKPRQDDHIKDLYSKVQAEPQRLPQEGRSLTTPAIQVNPDHYADSLKTLRSVLLKMGALKTIVQPFIMEYEKLESLVKDMEARTESLQRQSPEDIPHLNTEIEELHRKIEEQAEKVKHEQTLLPLDSEEISTAVQHFSIESLVKRAQASHTQAKSLLSQAALKPAQQAQKQLSESVQHIEEQRDRLQGTGSTTVHDIQQLYGTIEGQFQAIQATISAAPKGILLPEHSTPLSQEADALLQRARTASEAALAIVAKYQQNKRLDAATETFAAVIPPGQTVPKEITSGLETLKALVLSEEEILAYEDKMRHITSNTKQVLEIGQRLTKLPKTHPLYGTVHQALQTFTQALKEAFKLPPLEYQQKNKDLLELAAECQRKIQEAEAAQEEHHIKVADEQRQPEEQALPSGPAVEEKAQEEKESEAVELPKSTQQRLEVPKRSGGVRRRPPTRKPFGERYRPQEEHLVASPPEQETLQPTEQSTIAESRRPPPRGLPPGAALAGLAGAAAAGRTQLRRATPEQKGQQQKPPPASQIPSSRLRHVSAQKEPEPVLPFPPPEERLKQPSGKLELELQKGPVTDRLREFIKGQDLTNPRTAFKIALAITKQGIDTNAVVKGIFEDPDIDPFKLLFLADTIVIGLQKPELKDKIVVLLGAALNTPRNAEQIKMIQAYLNRELSKKERTPIDSLYGAIMNKLPRA